MKTSRSEDGKKRKGSARKKVRLKFALHETPERFSRYNDGPFRRVFSHTCVCDRR